MIKEIIDLYTNWRFWSFIIIAFLPLWFGIIGCSYLLIKEKINEVLHSRQKT